jgi:hypothetical protein
MKDALYISGICLRLGCETMWHRRSIFPPSLCCEIPLNFYPSGRDPIRSINLSYRSSDIRGAYHKGYGRRYHSNGESREGESGNYLGLFMELMKSG